MCDHCFCFFFIFSTSVLAYLKFLYVFLAFPILPGYVLYVSESDSSFLSRTLFLSRTQPLSLSNKSVQFDSKYSTPAISSVVDTFLFGDGLEHCGGLLFIGPLAGTFLVLGTYSACDVSSTAVPFDKRMMFEW